MRKRGRTDGNQDDIVKALRAIGCSVAITSALGDGFPDLLVGRAGFNYLIEVKDGTQPPSRKALTPDEVDFADKWRGHISIAMSVDDALRIVA